MSGNMYEVAYFSLAIFLLRPKGSLTAPESQNGLPNWFSHCVSLAQAF